MKWFGNALYDVDGYLILHSGRLVPAAGERVERNEGVGLVLDPIMAESWRECGEVWSGALNCLVVMNTMFEKKEIHKCTWQHPGTL